MIRSHAERTSRLTLVLGTLATMTACGGAAVPPPELVAARTAYEEASSGPAAELAPARLDTAKKALGEAENAWKEDPKAKEPETLTLAYIAERRARTTSAIGEGAQARASRIKLDEEYMELERKRASMTQEELERVRERLQIVSQKSAQTEAELAKERAARDEAEKRLSAAVASLAEMASVKEEARGMVITLNGSVLFTTGKYELLPIAKQKLDEVAKALQAQGFKKIVIEGHTDSRGTVQDNEQLSQRRAQSVKDHLVTRGLESQKIQAVGLAATRPLDTNDTPEGRANNRRVELIVTN
jgi:outer membrane protein OmpA-like peptidoglycan-associated protein